MPRKSLIALALGASLFAGAAAAETLYVKPGTSLNARSGPGTGYTRERTLSPGTAVVIVQRRGDWAQIRIGDLLFWVFASYLTDNAPSHPPAVVVPQPKVQPKPKPAPVVTPKPAPKPVPKPDVKKPDVKKPDIKKPDTKKPGGTKPQPDQPQPWDEDDTQPKKRPGN